MFYMYVSIIMSAFRHFDWILKRVFPFFNLTGEVLKEAVDGCWFVAQIRESIYDETSHKLFIFETMALHPKNERRLLTMKL